MQEVRGSIPLGSTTRRAESGQAATPRMLARGRVHVQP